MVASQMRDFQGDLCSLTDEVCGMTVGRWFGREVRLADSVFNSFFDFNGDAQELSAIL